MTRRPVRVLVPALVPALVALALVAPLLGAAPLRGYPPYRPSPALRAPHFPRTPHALRYAPGEVVVIADAGLLDAAPDATPRAGDPRVAGVLASRGLDRVRRAGPIRPLDGAHRERVWVLTSRRPDFDPVEASRALRETGAFRAVSPNYSFGLFITQPNDFYYSAQWYVDDGGFADVGLPYAWDIERGSSSVAIAIMDTGVDTGHPDLASKIWHNPGEIPGNGLDDDGNGLIDDVEGWDFGSGDNDPNPEPLFDDIGLDIGFHGTFCAGIAAAATNNGEGIAGAGWNCRIMPLKVANPDSGLSSSAIAAAFVYAVDEGASIISMSFGGPGDPGVPEFFQVLIDMATSQGVLCVAAAGNDGTDVPSYPAACDRVLAVAATDAANARADFSNWGPWVDVAAPGSTIWSTICRNYTVDDISQIFYIYFFYWDGENPYMYGDGTSFACPLTAGICGLVRSRYPSLTPGLVMQHVIATGDAVAYDHPIGKKVNAFAAVTTGPTAVAEEESTPPAMPFRAAPNPFEGSAAISFSLPGAGPARLMLFDASGRRVRTLADGTLAAGPHEIAWDGRNDEGALLGAAVYFAKLESAGRVVTTKIVLLER